MNDRTELNGRTLFHWRGPNPHGLVDDNQANTEALANAIASAAPNLFCRSGSLCWLNDDDQLIGVTPDTLKRIIGEHIAYVTLVPHNGGWRPEYHGFTFPQWPRHIPSNEFPHEPAERALQPDWQVLYDLHGTQLALRLPFTLE